MPIKKRKAFKPTEKFIISQFSTHTIPGFGWAKRILRGVPALREKDVRRFFFGQLISNIGSWMQIVALGWLVFQITSSAFWVGVVAACSSLPAVFFSLFGGWIVDHFPKKKVLIIAHTSSMVLAFILGLLTITDNINVTAIIIISLLGGVINSIYTPAHFSYISEIIHKDKLSSAMSINASVSSLGRIFGPVFAGFYIKVGGIGGAFIINGLSFLAVIVALLLIKKPSISIDKHLNPLQSIKEGLIYSLSNPMIRSIILYVGAASIFAWSYTTIIPVIAKDIFHTDATGMSNLYSAVGIGSIVATFLTAYFSSRVSKLAIFLAGNTIFSVSIFLFTFTQSLNLGLIYMFLSGLGLVTVNIVLGTIVQQMADPHYRGRVASIYFLVFGGVIFLGNLEIGYLAEHFGSPFALRINTIIMLVVGIYILVVKNKLRESQKVYNSKLEH